MTLLIWKREITLFKKNIPGTLIPGVMLPLIMLFALGKIVGSVVPMQTGTDYFSFVSSAIVVITMMTVSTFVTGFDHLSDFRFIKNYEEILTSPVKAWQMVLGKALGVTTKSLVVSILILIISVLLGANFLPLQPGYLLAIGALGLTGLFFSMFAMMCALVAPNHDAFAGMLNLVVMPLMFFSETFFHEGILGSYGWLLHLSPLYYTVRIFRDTVLFSISTTTMVYLGVITLLNVLMLVNLSNLLKHKLIN